MRGFEEKGAQVLGLSTDTVPSLRAWAQNLGGIGYPLLSDFYPHGHVLASYGLLNEEMGFARRAVVVIDKSGVVRHVQTYEPGTLPVPEEVLAEVAGLG